MNERYEFRDGKSAKFWSVRVKGTTVTTSWGRIGTDGQTKEKDYADKASALKDATKAAASKAKKGYVLCGGAAKKAASKTKSKKSPTPKKAAPKKSSKKKAAPKAAPKKASAKKAAPKAAPKKSSKKAAPKTARKSARPSSPTKTSGAKSRLEVDLSELEEVPAGWGYGQGGVPPMPKHDLADLRREALAQLDMKKLKKRKPGKALQSKKYSDWRYTGTLQGDPATSDELLAFVTGKTDELSEAGQIGLLHFGQSWYAPPIEVMRYHQARFGVMATFKAVCHIARYYYDYERYSLLLRADYEVDLDECTARLSQQLFELRHGVALLSAKEWKTARQYAVDAWDDIHPLMRPGVAFVLNDTELAERALETAPDIYYWNHHVNAAVATAEPEVAIKYVVRVPGKFLAFTPGVVRQWGHRAIPLLAKLASGLRRKGDAVGDWEVCKAMAATPDVAMMHASIEFLRHKGGQKFIATQFEKKPNIGGEAIRMALESKDPALRASARSIASLTDAKDSLLPTGKAAAEKKLPAFLVTPPWGESQKAIKLKPQAVELLKYKRKFKLPPGCDPKRKPHLWPKGQKKVIDLLSGHGYWLARFDSLLQLREKQFDEHVIPNAHRVTGSDPGLLIEKFGIDRVMALLVRRSTADSMYLLANADWPEVAPKMAEALGLKTCRDRARAWFSKYPEAAVIGLTPELFVKSKKRVSRAIAALCALNEMGHGKVILNVAKRYGGDAEVALKTLSEMDVLEIVPAKIPKLEKYFSLTSLDSPRLKKGGAYLGEDALKNFCTMLAFSNYEEEYPGIAMVADVCTPESLEAFAHSAFETWLAQGAPGSSSWAMLSLGWFAGDDAVRRLTPLIRKWPGEGGAKRAQLGLDVLAKIGTDAALSNVYSISQKLKYKSVKARAEEVVAEIAEGLELTPEQLGDRVVPDFGLDEDGTTWIDYGPRRFQVRMDETLTPLLFDESGKTLKSIPKPGKTDDAERAKEEKKRFGALKKDLRAVSKQQVQRLELAMCNRRTWNPDAFQEYFIDHPLVISLVRRLVFATGKTFFTVDETRQPVDAAGDPVALMKDVHIPHAIEWPVKKRAAWGEYFADYELLQPFDQIARQTFDVGDYKVKKGRIVDIGIELTAPKWVFGIEKRGWSRWDIIDGGAFNTHERLGGDGWSAVVAFDGAVAVSYIEEKEKVKVQDVSFSQNGKEVAPKDVDALFMSEVLRDIESLRP